MFPDGFAKIMKNPRLPPPTMGDAFRFPPLADENRGVEKPIPPPSR